MFSTKNGEVNMRMLTGIAAAAALMGAVSVANAATAQGKITAINASKDSITLNNGSTFTALRSAKLSNLKVGEKVTVAYNMRAGANEAVKITPAPGSNADLGG